MTVPRIVSADEWLAERKELLAAEEQAAKALVNISERRRNLPAVRIEKEYLFHGATGTVSLLEMFEGRRQLIVQHFMFDPAWDEGCPVCSYQADSVGNLAHLHARNTTFAAVSRTPISKVEPFRQRMGWTFPWYSSLGSDFNYDFHVTHDENVAPIQWNFMTKQELIDAVCRTSRGAASGAASASSTATTTPSCTRIPAFAVSWICSAAPTSTWT
jgi:predicted dithiol-disulfide oxidoreductase (DUF899 family)